MFGFTIIKKQKLRRLALDYQTKCLEVMRLKDKCASIESRINCVEFKLLDVSNGIKKYYDLGIDGSECLTPCKIQNAQIGSHYCKNDCKHHIYNNDKFVICNGNDKRS